MICRAGPVQEPTAFSSQEHCLLTFWKGFRELGRDDVHLFIVPDRSHCVHGVPAYPDAGFATWLAHLPPARRAREVQVHDPRAPGRRPAAGLVRLALRGEPQPPDYQDCHLLTEPGNRLVVRKNGERAEYRLRTASVIVPGGVLQSDFWSFRETFACN